MTLEKVTDANFDEKVQNQSLLIFGLNGVDHAGH